MEGELKYVRAKQRTGAWRWIAAGWCVGGALGGSGVLVAGGGRGRFVPKKKKN